MNIGILGGGQLARMLALAGHPLGLGFRILDPAPDACAATVAEHVCGAYDDIGKLGAFVKGVDLVTYEFENVPAESVHYLSGRVPVYPSADALATSRDRLNEKNMFRELDIPTPSFFEVNRLSDLEKAVDSAGLPAVLKTRTLGYDGKGQFVLHRKRDMPAAWEQLRGVPCILEGFISFTREVSVIGARGIDGGTVFYPLGENVHRNGILHLTTVRPGDPRQKKAEDYCERILQQLDYVGVMALELFDTGNQLIANEIAPRVHNSGHWSIEGAHTSQFENHLRAVLGLPLGNASATSVCAMVNYVGTLPRREDVLAIPNAHFHSYHKEPRPGRKIGHGTVCAESEKELGGLVERMVGLVEV